MSDDAVVDDPVPEIEPAVDAPEETDRIRAIAVAQGWRETGKLDPVEFLESIPKYSETLVSKLSALESRYDKLSKALGGQITAENERAKAVARQQIIEATEKGDSDAVLRAAEVLHAPVQAFDDVPADTQAVVKAWTDAPGQRWFRENPEMAADAAAMYDAELRRAGKDDPARILPIVEEKIRRLHAAHFTNANRERGSAATPVNTGRVTTTRRQVSADGLLEPRILEQYRKMGISDADILKSLEEYRGR